jgi:type IV secretory pathway component VirB8
MRENCIIVIADAVAICWTIYIVICFIKIDPYFVRLDLGRMIGNN